MANALVEDLVIAVHGILLHCNSFSNQRKRKELNKMEYSIILIGDIRTVIAWKLHKPAMCQ